MVIDQYFHSNKTDFIINIPKPASMSDHLKYMWPSNTGGIPGERMEGGGEGEEGHSVKTDLWTHWSRTGLYNKISLIPLRVVAHDRALHSTVYSIKRCTNSK